ncbi:hypothetical protein [Schumannella sp. 10F1B-5-1]|uniref:hypothetical protein n=1 Tax=Schumannella sp. 10F1B-5-1 TaxID=2590780 RepID=UPI00113142B0|nr:hypothetical protein [Schumannella sp. 10F1B-5-1]TPW70826.1 hypothetical protein FJ658_11955 [Schumannella sp. 10F1B-5-1]
MPRAPRLAAPRRSAVAALALCAALAVALSGCASGAAEPTSKPSATKAATKPSASPTEAPATTAKVVIDADSVSVLDSDGGTVADVPFVTDAVTAASQLQRALDETPVAATVTDDTCYPQLDEQSFGGLHLFSSVDGLTRPDNAGFYVTADAATTTGGVPIEIPSGQAIGATRTAVLEGNVQAPRFDVDGGLEVHYDVAGGSPTSDPSQYFGALARIESGKLALIDAPIYFAREC